MSVHHYGGVDLSGADYPSGPLRQLRQLARTNPSAPFLTAHDAHKRWQTLTYGQTELHSRNLAHWIRENIATPPAFALAPVNNIPSVIAALAVLRSEVPLHLLNPSDPVARQEEQTAALGSVPLCQVGGGGLARGNQLPDAPSGGGATPLVDTPDPLRPWLYFGTSGSTASSKMVAQTLVGARANAEGIIRHHRLRGGERFLGCLPIYHVNGFHLTLLATLANGGHALLLPRFEPFDYPRQLERFEPHLASVVPSILTALTRTWRRASVPPAFRYFITAAAPLRRETVAQVTQRIGARIHQGYGLTETINFSTTVPAGIPDAVWRRQMLEAKIPSVGTALYGNEVAVLSPEGRRLPLGASGEVVVRGHNVMRGYEGNPSATAEAFRHGWFHTGDIGVLSQDPDWPAPFLSLTGRLKNIAKVAGAAVSLEELDRALVALDGVEDAAAFGRPHRILGEEVVVAIKGSVDLDAARTWLADHVPAQALPQEIVRVDQIPHSPTGKVQRRQLAALVQQQES